MGVIVWVGKGSGQVSPGFREGEFQAKERAPANTNIFAHHILSLMQKKERKSPIALKYLLNKVLLLKLLKIQLS